jgi:hypothetical protein
MTPRAGLLLLANLTVVARMSGEPAVADALACIYIAFASAHVYSSNQLRAAVRAVRS